EDGIRDWSVTGVQTCALPILRLIGRPVSVKPKTAITFYAAARKRRWRGRGAAGARPAAGFYKSRFKAREVLVSLLRPFAAIGARSEERRVGREWRSREVA